MKTIILLLTIIFTISLFSCNDNRLNTNPHNIYYIKDKRTGLCFAEVGMGNTYSFTCVPCDSVKLYLNAE